ncbi:mechanosensitive ion channel family protein [Candidatus Cloacimonadota bacterium]
MSIEGIANFLSVSEIQAKFITAGFILVISILSYLISKYILLHVILKLSKKTKTLWDDKLVERRVFDNLNIIIPLLIIYFSAELFPAFQLIISRFSKIGIVWFTVLAVSSLLSAINDIYLTTRNAGNKPIKGYLQIVKIFFFIIGCIVILGILLGRSPWVLVSGLGAMTAILLLIFKDTILSLIASLQISFNDLVKVGDWLSVPQFNADGDVIDIALHTVKIQNWDKTISVIPTHKLIEGTFKNWRGMQDSGGRRIKRAIFLDISSIRFCDKKMLSRFRKIQLIENYLENIHKEIENYNLENNIDTSELINGRNLTNVGVFRKYIEEYLKHNTNIRKDMTFLIRQLSPGSTGLPLEIYVFINDINWANYEAIQADIFDHILAVVPEFGLSIFQYPTNRVYIPLETN